MSNKKVTQSSTGLAMSALQRLCQLSIDKPAGRTTGTGIMCTLGPASLKPAVIAQMIAAGMGIARLNLSHGTLADHLHSLKLIAEAEKQLREVGELTSESCGWPRPVAVAVDTRGSEIRTGLLTAKDQLNETVTIETGSRVTIDCSPAGVNKPITPQRLWINFADFAKLARPGQVVYIDDGLLELQVEDSKASTSTVDCLVIVGGRLGGGKSVCLPGLDTRLPEIDQQDLKDIQALCSDNTDGAARVGIVMASFVRNPETVRRLRAAATVAGRPEPLIVAKIGDLRGLRALEEILQEADGVLVARGDLGSELRQEKVFAAQKRIIAICSTSAKASICATHLLDSMLTKSGPTRAEASDVANAVIDGADCLMLSGETAVGRYPVEAVRTLAKICREAESNLKSGQHWQQLRRHGFSWMPQQQQQEYKVGKALIQLPADPLQSSALAACEAALRCRAVAILVATNHAALPRLAAMCRPPCPVICVCSNEAVCRGLNLWYGLHPLIYDKPALDDWLLEAQSRLSYATSRAVSTGMLPEPANHSLVVVLVEKLAKNSSDILAIVPMERLLPAI